MVMIAYCSTSRGLRQHPVCVSGRGGYDTVYSSSYLCCVVKGTTIQQAIRLYSRFDDSFVDMFCRLPKTSINNNNKWQSKRNFFVSWKPKKIFIFFSEHDSIMQWLYLDLEHHWFERLHKNKNPLIPLLIIFIRDITRANHFQNLTTCFLTDLSQKSHQKKSLHR